MDIAVKVALVVAAAVALWPTWVTFQRLLYSRRYWLLVPLMLMAAAGLIALGLWLPGAMHDEVKNGQYDLLIDFLLFGFMPLVVIALAAYVIDHIADRPTAAIVTTAGCVAMAALPLCFVLFEDRLRDWYGIGSGRSATGSPMLEQVERQLSQP